MKPSPSLQTITLGGGCFWCTEAVYKEVQGVVDVESGYCNGHTKNPRYEEVCSGQTGHCEVVKLVYDTALISTREILEIFFLVHDCTQLNRQGNDEGTQYRSGIYCASPEQQTLAEDFIKEMRHGKLFDKPIVTEVLPVQNYFAAEAYHQDFFERNPQQGYCMAVAGPKVAKFRQTFARLAK